MTALSVWVLSKSGPGSAQWTSLFEAEGWRVRAASQIRALLEAVEPHQSGIALLDLALLVPVPARAVRSIKARAPGLAVLVATAGDVGADRSIELLEAGADDVILQALPPALVLAKLRVHARRLVPALGADHGAIRAPKGDLKLDPARRGLWLREKDAWVSRSDLTAIEMRLLALLVERPGVAVERRFILETVWKDRGVDVSPGTIDKHVESLRKKLGKIVGGRIRTVHGVGYVYRE